MRTTEGLDICESPDTIPPESPWERGYDDLASKYEPPSTSQQVKFTLPNSAPPQYHVPNYMPGASGGPALPALPDTGIASRRATMHLNLGLAHRLRSSFADMRSTHNYSGIPDSPRPPNITNADVTTTAAAIRLAAARVSVAPLALPSPEHELTDPMRGVTATIPGSHPPEFLRAMENMPKSPNVTRKTRLSSFWQGTQDVEESRLPTIEASPPDPTDQSATQDGFDFNTATMSFVPPPATAPVKLGAESEDDDYFGSIDTPPSSDGTNMNQHVVDLPRTEHEVARHTSVPLLDIQPATVPALPRRICLTRQTSAPVPTLAPFERRLRSARPASDSSVLSQAGRAAKEEQMFNELGYLTPPNPPDELERRRALYK